MKESVCSFFSYTVVLLMHSSYIESNLVHRLQHSHCELNMNSVRISIIDKLTWGCPLGLAAHFA